MSKSFKFKNGVYLDTTGISYKRNNLQTILDNIISKNSTQDTNISNLQTSVNNINTKNNTQDTNISNLQTSLTSLTNRVVALEKMKDFVVEQGTSGVWTYRKWNSGVSECWGQPNITTYSGNGTTRILVTTSDSYKTYYYQIDVPLPSGVFTSVNCINATAIDAGTGTSACCVEYWSTTSFRMVTWGSTASADNGQPLIHVFGRWK